MRIGWIMLIVLGLCGCAPAWEVSNLNNDEILVLGHGGAGFATFRNPLPPNSFPSVKQAIEVEGADGVEIDVRFSADGVPVLYHDGKLDDASHCEGCVEQFSWEELNSCRFKLRLGTGPKEDFHLVRLESVLERYAEWPHPPLIYINAKPDPICPITDINAFQSDFARELDRLIQKYNAESWTLVETSSVTFLQKLSELNPAIRLYLGINDFELARDLVLENDFEGLVISNNDISAAQIQEMHLHGKWVGLFGIKIKSGAKSAIKKNPEMLLSDDIRMTKQLLRE